MKKIMLPTFSIYSMRKILPVILIALQAGVLVTFLTWVGVSGQPLTVAYWAGILLPVGLGLWLKRGHPAISRVTLALAVFAGVSLVYLFPELFGPGCNGMPKAFAACPPSCQIQTCSQWVAKGDPLPSGGTCNPSNSWDKGCCLSYATTCDPNCSTGGGGGGGGGGNTPPTISAVLSCNLAGSGNWCRGGLSLDLTATDAESTILVSGDLNGVAFACNNGQPSPSPAQCSIALGEGTGTAHFTATDTSGATDNGSKTWSLDSIPPTASGSLSGTLGANNWYISSVRFTASGDDTGSGLSGVSCTLDGAASACNRSVKANGSHTLVITASDKAGNSAVATKNFSIDTQAPTLTASLSGTGGANNWYTSATLNASTSDPAPSSGAPTLEVSLDGGSWVSFGGSYNIPEGVHTLDVRATDGAGNITQAAQIEAKVDSVAPTLKVNVSGTSGNNDWYTSTAQVSASASDATSGINIFEYSLDNGNTWAAYTGPISVNDGVQSISFYAEDATGQSVQVEQTVKVDTQAPHISGSLSGTPGSNGWYISNVTLSAAASDATSGVASFTYTLDGGPATAYTSPITLTDGQHTLVLDVEDQAGLTDSFSQSIKVDTVAPTLNILSALPEWVQDTLTLSGTASDVTSGLSRVEVSTDNGSTWKTASGTSSWRYPWNTHKTSDGAHTLRVRSTDAAGLTTQQVFTAQVDNSIPHIELPAEWDLWDTVVFDAWDHDSGLKGAEIVISDPQGRWPKRHLSFAPGQLPVNLKWDRRFAGPNNSGAGGTVAPLGDYPVDAWASDNLGHSRHVKAVIHISLGGSILLPPAPATALPSPQPTATPTQTSIIPTETATPTSTSGPGTGPNIIFGTPQVTAQASPTPTSLPVVRATPTQTNIITIIQSIFSPPPSGAETTSDFESDPGPSLLAATQADPGQMASNIAFGGAAAAAIATFAAYIEQKKREEEQAAARSRETARLRHMTPEERRAYELKQAIAAQTEKEQKEWKAERYEQISHSDVYKESDNKTAFMHNQLEQIKQDEAAYREKQKEAARRERERLRVATTPPPPEMPPGLSPEAQQAFLHGGTAATDWIAANASDLQAQYQAELAQQKRDEQVAAFDDDMSPEEKLAAYQNTDQYKAYQKSLANWEAAQTPGKGINGLAAPTPQPQDDDPFQWLKDIWNGVGNFFSSFVPHGQSAKNATPTVDIPAIQTQNVAKIYAQITQTAQAMPSLTPTPTLTPTSTPTPLPETRWVTYPANLRAGPSMSEQMLGTLGLYSQVQPTGRSAPAYDLNGNPFTYMEVTYGQQKGWLASNFLETIGHGGKLLIDPNKTVYILDKYKPRSYENKNQSMDKEEMRAHLFVEQDLNITVDGKPSSFELANLTQINASLNFNLCGEFVAAYVTGRPIETLITDWINQAAGGLRDRARQVINDRKEVTSYYDVTNMLDQYHCKYKDFETPFHDEVAGATIVTPGRLKAQLDQGYALIMSVNVNEFPGELNQGTTPHWVVLDDVAPQEANSGQVLVYNPMPNAQELYSYDTLLRAAGGNVNEDGKTKPPAQIHIDGIWVDRNSCQ